MSEGLKITPTTNDLMGEVTARAHMRPPVVVSSVNFQPSRLDIIAPLEEQPSLPGMEPAPPLIEAEAPPASRPEKKIAIIGTAPSSRGLAPYNDESWEIWACSAGNMNMVPRVTLWFELHNTLLSQENVSWGGPYLEWLAKQSFPLFMQDNRTISRAMPFPKDEMVKEFSKFFFNSSFSWMMAFAIHVGATEIGLFGVDLASNAEYVLQRTAGHYFCLEAQKRGIKVWTPAESDMLHAPGLYGYAEATPFGRKLQVRKMEIENRIAEMQPQIQRMQQQVVYLQGALEDVNYMQMIWQGLA